MVYLQSRNVIHRDLSARNLLVSNVDGKYEAKVADFGLSRETDEYKAESSLIPIRWSAPEVLQRKAATSKSDVFSFAIVIHEILTFASIPYENIQTNREVMDFVIKGKRMPKVTSCSEKLYDLMMDCWKEDPADRPNFMEVLERLQDIAIEDRPVLATNDSIYGFTNDQYQDGSKAEYSQTKYEYDQ